MSADDAPDRLVTLTEAADLTDVSRSTIRRYLDDGRFPGARQDDDGRAAWHVPIGDLTDAGLTVRDPDHEQDADGSTGQGEQSQTSPTMQVEPGTAVVPLSELSGLFQQVANAEARAARAEAVLEHTQQRLTEAREAAQEADESRSGGMPPWLVPTALLVALALATVALVLAVGA